MPKWLKIALLLLATALGIYLAVNSLFEKEPPDWAKHDKDAMLAIKWAEAGDRKDTKTLKSMAHKSRQGIVETYMSDIGKLPQYLLLDERTVCGKRREMLPNGVEALHITVKETLNYKEQDMPAKKPKKKRAKRRQPSRMLHVYLYPEEKDGPLKVVGARYPPMMDWRGGNDGMKAPDKAMDAIFEWVNHFTKGDIPYCGRANNNPIEMGCSEYSKLPPNPHGERGFARLFTECHESLRLLGGKDAGENSGFRCAIAFYVQTKGRKWRKVQIEAFQDSYWGGVEGAWMPSHPFFDWRWQDWDKSWKSEDDCVEAMKKRMGF